MNPTTRFYQVFVFALLLALSAISGPASPPSNPEFINIDELQTGTVAVGYTVLSSEQGLQPFDAKIIGVMRNFIGPHEDLVVAELSSPLFKRAGVVSGMSGSPVYVGNRLLGAVGYGLGEFTETPIVGITPIKSMLSFAGQKSSALNATLNGHIKPIALSLVGRGLSPESLSIFKDALAQKGYAELSLATQSLGKKSDKPSKLFAGGPVAAVIVDGDLSIAAIGTVTYVKDDAFVAFGHPFMQVGDSHFAAASADIVTTIFSQRTSTKLGQPTGLIGSVTSDRAAGIGGHIGPLPQMVPVSVEIDGKMNRFQIAPIPKDFSLYTALTLVNSLLLRPSRNLGGTLEASAVLKLNGGEELTLRHRVSGPSAPLEGELAKQFLDELEYVLEQPFAPVKVDSVTFRVQSSQDVKRNILMEVSTPQSVRQDQNASFRVRIQPYKEAALNKVVSFKIPRALPVGTYQVVIADRMNALRLGSESGLLGHPTDLTTLLSQVKTLPSDWDLCFYLVRSDANSELSGFALPDLPLSLQKLSSNFAIDDSARHGRSAYKLGCSTMDDLTVGMVSGTLTILPSLLRSTK